MEDPKFRGTFLKIRVCDGCPFAAVEDLLKSMRGHKEAIDAGGNPQLPASEYIERFTNALEDNVAGVVVRSKIKGVGGDQRN